ncbi:LysR family transcriptional regulator [Pediococcus claussenii]|nr:LysR family transcriptional regulator [Pediococcus claussenii]ANZ69238.1 LysR family transcriptional regulator [Pediococcus claussenii]ANZ71057.1 LysR family transcriptional regulator [Pediococcus claussenii]
MNIKDLNYFHELVHTRNFSEVAKKFKVSQPTISLSIRRLEEEFQTTLFSRDQGQHHLEVTISGQQLDEHVITILDQINIAHNEINNVNTKKVTLGLPPIMTSIFFPSIAANLNKNGLLDSIIPFAKGSADLIKMLLNGQLDMTLIGSIEELDRNQLFVEQLAQSPFKIIVGKESPHFGKDHIYFSELSDDNFISLDTSFIHSKALKVFSHNSHFRPNIIYQSNEAQVIQEMVQNNVGVGFLVDAAIKPNSDMKVLNLLDEDQPTFHMNLAYRNDHILNPLQKQVMDLILEATKNRE